MGIVSRSAARRRSLAVLAAIVVLVPVTALAARRATGWRPATVSATRIGPLTPLSWAPSGDDYLPDGDYPGRYATDAPIDLPPPRSPGALGLHATLRFSVTVPGSAALGFDAAFADVPDLAACGVAVHYLLPSEGGASYPVLAVDATSVEELDRIGGTRTITRVVEDLDDLRGLVVRAEIYCYGAPDPWTGTYEDVTMAFDGTPIEVSVDVGALLYG